MGFPESPVEPITKLCDMPTEMTSADTMINTMNGALEIRNQGMVPRQHLYRILPRANNHREILDCARVQTSIRPPSIGNNLSLFSKLLSETLGDLISSQVFHLFHSGRAWFIVIYLYCCYDFSFSLYPSTTFTKFRSSKVGIINLNKTGKFVVCVPLSFCFANLMAHSPYCLIAPYLQHPLKQQHGDTSFLPGHQKDHPKLLLQGNPGFVKPIFNSWRYFSKTLVLIYKELAHLQ